MEWASRRAFWVVLLLLACGVYAPALSYGFISYDDEIYVFNNRMVSSGFTWDGLRWAFEGQHIGHYHPLTWLSHQLDVSLFGLDGRGHHATSLLLHAASTLLLFVFLRRATGHTGRSGVVALLFALHPLHVEPVVWIASRKDVLSTLFWMLALVAYERYRRAPTVVRYATVALAYVLGLLSKPMVVTLPVILLLLDYWPLGRVLTLESASAGAEPRESQTALLKRIGMLVAEKIPLFLLAGVSAWVTTTSASSFGVMKEQTLPLMARIENSLLSYVLYLRELVVPVDLSIHHERFMAAPDVGQLWGALAVLAIFSAAALRLWRSHPYLLTGWSFYLVSFLPVIGLLQYGGHSIADRYAYVPSIGAFILVVWGLHALLGRLPNGNLLQRAITGAVTLVFGLLALLQVGYWRSGEELFQHALDVAPDNPRLLNLLGMELARRGAVDEAVRHYGRAIELAPSFTKPMNNLGVLLHQRGRTSEAIGLYERLLRIEPDDPKGHANLARALASSGRAVEAEKHFRIAILGDPAYAGARLGLARLLASLGRTQDAEAELEAAVELYPSRSDLQSALAEIRARSQGSQLEDGR
ncbi:MAG TPA: tetratricopeptide repeat protein [Polyangiaceae bacterium]|nr:tetratricopeptide repeat protein [Polyangiaceae bacterium]